MTDQSVDLLSAGEGAAPEEEAPAAVDDGTAAAGCETTTAGDATEQQGGASVDLLGLGDSSPPAPAAASSDDVASAPPPAVATEDTTTTTPVSSTSPETEEDKGSETPTETEGKPTENGVDNTAAPSESTSEAAAPEQPNEETTAADNSVGDDDDGDDENRKDTPSSATNNDAAVAPTKEQNTAPNSQQDDASSGEQNSNGHATLSSPAVSGESAASATEEETPPPAATATTESSTPVPAKDEDPESKSTSPSENIDHHITDTDQLRDELRNARAELESVRAEQARRMEDDGALLMELQTKLQEHMSARAEAENRARLAEQSIESLTKTNHEQGAELDRFREMEEHWHSQKTDQAEIENDFRVAKQQVTKVEEEKESLRETITNLQKEVDDLQKERMDQEEELKTIREQRDEQERREIALTNRLNGAKKKEADKANLAEHFEDETKALKDEANEARQQVEELTEAKTLLEDELVRVKSTSEARVRQAELALADERRLNEDRKGKMKVFIEKKSEELRQARADGDSLQTELNQTSRSLMDLNGRWKQLHAQWVQSQTRNRELQRDLNRIKKDSENLHKVGDTLEMKLSRSANETEEHKNKRLAAKNELMTVLRTLEAEREVSARLRDAIKFTFTPKALSQQQLLKEALEEFENELMRLSRRFGKPLPPVSAGGLDASERSQSNGAEEGSVEEEGKASRTEGDSQKLIGKLDHETQGISQYIMALTGEIEKLHMLIDISGSRNCYTALSDILLGGAQGAAPADGARENVAESSVPLRAIRSHQYGQVPSNAAT